MTSPADVQVLREMADAIDRGDPLDSYAWFIEIMARAVGRPLKRPDYVSERIDAWTYVLLWRDAGMFQGQDEAVAKLLKLFGFTENVAQKVAIGRLEKHILNPARALYEGMTDAEKAIRLAR